MKRNSFSYISIIFIMVMILNLSFGTISIQPVFADETKAVTFQPNYLGQFVGMLPTGWSGQNIKMGTWANFEFAGWGAGNTGLAIYDSIIWTGALTYTFDQINVYGGTGLLYFCYTDSDNYYAVSIGTTTKLIKKEGGVETVLATDPLSYRSKEYKIKIVRTIDGKITVSTTPKGAVTPVTVWFDSILDTTFNTGKIGMGFTESGGYYSAIKAVGTQLIVTPPSPVPSPTPTPTPPPGLSVSADPKNASNARYLSRSFTLGDAVEMRYPMSGLEFMVEKATAVTIDIKRGGDDNKTSYYGIFLDDSLGYTVYPITETAYKPVIIVQFEKPRDCKVRIVKLCGQDTTLSIKNINAYGTETVAPTIFSSQTKTRKIEFIGDSIMIGKGAGKVKGMGEDAWRSFSSQTAGYFDADFNVSAVGGGGLTQTIDSFNPYFYYKYSYSISPSAEMQWNFTQFSPDIVVVNVGTNDGTENTVAKYVQLVELIRSSHNDTQTKKIPIILTSGPINSDTWNNLTTAVSQLNSSGDNNVYSLNLGQGKINGGNGYPSAAQQAEASGILIGKIKEILPEWNPPL